MWGLWGLSSKQTHISAFHNEVQSLAKKTRHLGHFPYKMAYFTRVKNCLNAVQNVQFSSKLLMGMWKPSLWILVSKFQVVLEFWSIKLSSFHFLILKWTFFILLILKACNSTAVKNSAAKTHWEAVYITAINWWKSGVFFNTFRWFFIPVKIAIL